MPRERLKSQGLGENISNIVVSADVLNQDGGRRQARTEPVILHGERLGTGSHAWRIRSRESQSRHVVFEDSGDGRNAISKTKLEDAIDLEEQTAKVDQRTHSLAERNVLAFHGRKADFLNPFGFPENRNLAKSNNVPATRLDSV